MLHKYANFDDAYTAFSSIFANAKQHRDWAQINMAASYPGSSDPVDRLHFGYLCGAVGYLINCVTFLADLTETYYWQSDMFESIYWASQGGEEYELTMQKILDQVWESSPLETFFFVNYIDGMRAAIWNKDMQIERFEDIYKHFLT